MNNKSAKVMLREFPKVEQQLCGYLLWNNVYFVRPVWDKGYF
jgi:hypothetical protein